MPVITSFMAMTAYRVDILWSIVINHLPKLQEEVYGLLHNVD